MPPEEIPPNIAKLMRKSRAEKETGPTVIVEDPKVRQDPLFVKIRAMIESGEASRLLNGRGY